MEKYLLIAFMLFAPAAKQPTKPIVCCGKTATEQFAAFASDPNFVKIHVLPASFNYVAGAGADIHFTATDGTLAHGYEFKAAKKTNNYLLVIHDYLGLGDYAKYESEKYFKSLKDVNVIAIDLYDNKTTTNPDSARKLMQAVTTVRATAIIQGAIKMLGKNARIGTIGWCFGGGWSLQTALAAKQQTVACVVFYGMPEQDVTKLKTLHSDVLGIFANKDKWITPAVVTGFEENMKKAGKTLTVNSYDADHGFGNPNGPTHNDLAASDAYSKAEAYLHARFK